MNKDQSPDHFDVVPSSGISPATINTIGYSPFTFFRIKLPQLTLETALWSMVLVLTLSFRWFALTASPLNGDEGMIAYSAWQLQHLQVPLDWREPLTVVLSAVGFLCFGSSDFVARLIPLLAGSSLPLLLYWTRPILGRPAALSAGLLLAISPSFVFFSRFLSGDILAVLITVILLILFSGIGARPGRWRLFVITVLLALLLNCGPTGWTLILAALFALAALYAVGYWPATCSSWIRAIRDDRTGYWQLLAVFAFTFLLLGNLFRPGASAAIVPGLVEWLAQFGSNQGARTAYAMPGMLGYEPLLLLSGLASALSLLHWKRLGLSRDELSLRLFLMFWSLFAVFVFLLSNRDHAGSILAALLPLGLLGGDVVAGLFSRAQGLKWRSVLLTLIPASIFIVYLWLVAAQAAAGNLTPAWIVVPLTFLVAGVIAVSAMAAVHLEGARALNAFGILLTFIIGAQAIHSTVWVWRSGPAELMVKIEASPQIRSLAQELTSTSNSFGLSGSETTVVTESLRPSLAWYLRDLPGLTFAAEVRPGPQTVLAPASPVNDWTGYDQKRYRLVDVWRPEAPSWSGVWRWFVYRETFGKVDSQFAVILDKKD